MQDSAFQPIQGGNTAVIGITALGYNTTAWPHPPGMPRPTDYRIRCLTAGYLSWDVPTATTVTSKVPAAGAPVLNTVGMSTGQIEVLKLPMGAQFISSVAAGFEITAGEGI
jgi:hypothetical protein